MKNFVIFKYFQQTQGLGDTGDYAIVFVPSTNHGSGGIGDYAIILVCHPPFTGREVRETTP